MVRYQKDRQGFAWMREARREGHRELRILCNHLES